MEIDVVRKIRTESQKRILRISKTVADPKRLITNCIATDICHHLLSTLFLLIKMSQM